MRWSLTDDLAVLIVKAEWSFLNLNLLLHGNVVAAALSVREEERNSAAMRNREVVQNYQGFLDNFEEWIHDNDQNNPSDTVQDDILDSLRELAEALDQ